MRFDKQELKQTLMKPANLVTAVILLLGLFVTFKRFFFGIGSVTNLDDNNPWGLWISFDLLCGVVLAAQLEVSKGHLIRSFAAAVGMPPGKYLNLVRVENAKRLLAEEGHNLEITALLCGFSGANYLCKVFKSQTGESPAAWRRLHCGQAAPGPNPSAGWDEPEDTQLSPDEWDEQVWV